MASLSRHDRGISRLLMAAMLVAGLLAMKVLGSIVWEYQRYFPADFNSAFLSGKRSVFQGSYRFAFYAHILVGPPTILAAIVLLHSGFRGRYQALHRSLGRIQAAMVLLVLVPTGLVMATKAYAGPVSGWGFASLSLATGTAMALTIDRARRRQFASHQQWAIRTTILLLSPLFSRVIAGAAISSGLETETFYIVNAWASWLVPCVVYEACLRCSLPRPLLATLSRERVLP